ncbi:MAG: Membrane protein insertase YidC [Prosthecobacter sp.]|nr:Membrane protein insertase YidC [Prosthecobacter sp.]
MDRKGWIVVILCSVGIAFNVWYTAKHAPPPPPPAVAAEKKTGSDAKAVSEAPASKATPAAAGQPAPAAAASLPEETHTLTRGSVTWHFTTRGGGISKVVLAGTDQLTLNEHGKEPIGALRREAAGNDPVAYKIVSKTDKGITFEGVGAEGIQVRKVFSLHEGSPTDEHLIKLSVTLTNQAAAPHKSEEYYLYAGAANSMSPDEALKPSFFWNDAGNADQVHTSSFEGGWFSTEQTEMRSSHARLRYGGVMSRFYVQILSHESKTDKPGKIWASRVHIDHSQDKFKGTSGADKDHAIQAAVGLPPVELAPAASVTEEYSLYAGPKEYDRLAKLEGQREFVMFYGMWGFISRPLNTLMRWMHDLTGNWGFAIILMTIIIRTILWPLQAKAQYSMKRMGKLAPLMKELQEKHKDNPTQQQMEVMKLYKEYGVNPVGGCLPMLLQIPIFFAFYGVLQNAAELRGQGWLWVKDLSISDTIGQFMGIDINPLPLIMGVTMIAQMKLTPQPATMDKSQKMMMNIMPFFFLWICYNFASALALYWAITNIYAIAQSWIMKLYMPEPELKKVEHAPRGPAPVNPFFNPANPQHKEKKSKPRSPKLGG